MIYTDVLARPDVRVVGPLDRFVGNEAVGNEAVGAVTARSAVLHSTNDLLTVAIDRNSENDSTLRLKWGQRTWNLFLDWMVRSRFPD